MFYEQLFLLSISDHLFYKIRCLKNESKFKKNYTSSSREYSLELSELFLPNDDSFEFYYMLLKFIVFISILNRLSMR